MANVPGLMEFDRLLAASDAAALASGQMLLRVTNAAFSTTGLMSINDRPVGGGQMKITTRPISGLMEIRFETE